MITGDAKYGAYYPAEAFISPSHQENFGISIVEALACGTPVLITNKVEIWRHIHIYREAAGLIEEDTIEGTTKLFRSWLSKDAQGRESITARTVRCFETHFSIERSALAIDDLFEEGRSSVPNGRSTMSEALLNAKFP